MNFRRKIMVVFLVGIMVFSISACGPSKIAKEAPQEMVTLAMEKLKVAKSLSSTMTFEAKMVTGEQASEATAEVEADIIYEPLSLQVLGVSESEAQTPVEIKTYAQEENGALVSYAAYGNQWIKQNVDKESLLSSIRMYDTKANILAFLEKASDVKEVSRENKEVVLEIIIPEKDFQGVAESTQLFQMLGLSGLPSEYFKEIGDLSISFVMDELTGLPKSYKLNLSSSAQALINNVNHYLAGASEEGSGATVPTVTVERFVINVQVDSVDKTEKIIIPKEALEGAVNVAEQMKINEQSTTDASESAETLHADTPLDQEGTTLVQETETGISE